MGRFRYHIFMCINERSVDDPRGSCTAKGSARLQELFKSEVKRRGLDGQVRANKAGCLDACEHGPTVVVYPDAVWYQVKTDADVLEVMDRHIGRGEVVTRLMIPFAPPANLSN